MRERRPAGAVSVGKQASACLSAAARRCLNGRDDARPSTTSNLITHCALWITH